ncbi:MAG TPA: VacJ family lipoprotein [Cellvibrio sp.]|nr:VacJ family lipoprotein [Cellvibrio sp.]
MNSQLSKIFFLAAVLPCALNTSAETAADVAPVEISQTAPATAVEPVQEPFANESGENLEAPDSNSVDPWQGYNRAMFTFNNRVDRHLLKPLAKTYVRLTPAFFRQGVSNAFANILDVPNALNGVLQGKFSGAARDTGRVLVNTTLGLAGVLDVAQHMGLKAGDGEDFGQTLAVWGVGSGPYVVLPFIGPSTLRDSVALPVDWYTDPKAYIDYVPTANTVRGVSIINTRASYLQLEKTVSGDKYLFIRDIYLQRRNYLVNDGEVEDSFGADESDGDYGN